MKESDAISFYVGLIRLAPELRNLSENQAISRCGNCFSELFNISPTRDHIRTAFAKFKTGGIKRAWTLKYRYMVRLFLMKPEMTTKDAAKIITQKFNQRTRMSVIESAKEEAKNFPADMLPAEFIMKVEEEYNKLSKDVTLI